jgi:dolichyl-phosphate-mannose--protein O-mannosyl transferase
VLSRPAALYSACPEFCGFRLSTEQEILAIGTPAIWWGATAAGLFCLVWWAMRRGPPHASRARRAAGAIGTGAYLIAALANFAYLYPIMTAKVIPYSAWLSRMWFSNWI